MAVLQLKPALSAGERELIHKVKLAPSSKEHTIACEPQAGVQRAHRRSRHRFEACRLSVSRSAKETLPRSCIETKRARCLERADAKL